MTDPPPSSRQGEAPADNIGAKLSIQDLERELKILTVLKMGREMDAGAKDKGSRWAQLWNSPMALAIVAALVGYIGTLITWSLSRTGEQTRHHQSLDLEKTKQEADEKMENKKLQGNLILEAMKTGEAQRAAANLLLLADAKLISLDEATQEKLKERAGNVAPSLPIPNQSGDPALDKGAYAKMRSDAAYAVEILNDLFGKSLKVPTVEPTEMGLSTMAYFDPSTGTIHAPPALQHIPDMLYRQAAHMYQPKWDFEDQSGALSTSIADVMASVVKQKRLNQTADTADWVLYQKGLAWWREDDLSRTADLTPLRSLKDPGRAYDDSKIGKDNQVAHMKDYVPPSNDPINIEYLYRNSGIPSKAFYEVAMKLGTDDTARLWIAAMGKLESSRNPTFAEFATETVARAETPDAKAAATAAWKSVGVEPLEE